MPYWVSFSFCLLWLFPNLGPLGGEALHWVGARAGIWSALAHKSLPATRTLVTAKDRILKPHIVKYNEIALKRRLVKFLEKRPIFIVGMKTYVKRSISFDWHIRYQLRAAEFCKNIFIVHLASNVMLFQKNSAVELKFKKEITSWCL